MNDDIRVAVLRAPPAAFRSGRVELDDWLARYGLAATRSGSARVYLAEDQTGVVGYCALSAGSVDPSRAGTRTRSGLPRHPIPVVLLARLAVSEHAQGRGLGRLLIEHAALATVKVSRLVLQPARWQRVCDGCVSSHAYGPRWGGLQGWA